MSSKGTNIADLRGVSRMYIKPDSKGSKVKANILKGDIHSPPFFHKIKPCHCGRSHKRMNLSLKEGGWAVFCDGCGYYTNRHEYSDDAVQEWNDHMLPYEVYEDL